MNKEEKAEYRRKYYQTHKHLWAKSAAKNRDRINARSKLRAGTPERKATLRRYYERHPEVNKKYYQNNREHIRKRVKANQEKVRKAFLEMYGSKCECCGETTREFLTVDHVQRQVGVRKKVRGHDAYRQAIKQYQPDVYRTFCMNCNFATRFGQKCPHQSKAAESN